MMDRNFIRPQAIDIFGFLNSCYYMLWSDVYFTFMISPQGLVYYSFVGAGRFRGRMGKLLIESLGDLEICGLVFI